MKYFDLTLPEGVNEKSPKIHKVLFDDFKKAWVDFPRPLAERMVELGYGKWAPCGVDGKISVPQQLILPMQFLFIRLPHGSVKAVHVWSLVGDEDRGFEPPKDLAGFAVNLVKDVWYEHDEADQVDPDEYDKACEEYDTEGAVDITPVDITPEPV